MDGSDRQLVVIKILRQILLHNDDMSNLQSRDGHPPVMTDTSDKNPRLKQTRCFHSTSGRLFSMPLGSSNVSSSGSCDEYLSASVYVATTDCAESRSPSIQRCTCQGVILASWFRTMHGLTLALVTSFVYRCFDILIKRMLGTELTTKSLVGQ